MTANSQVRQVVMQGATSPVAYTTNVLDNLNATTDPGVSNGQTQGYYTGSIWMNQTTGRIWQCATNAAGTAVWFLAGVVPGTGIWPSSMLAQFGGGAGTILGEGNINRQISAAGVVPGATAADNVLAVYSLPGGSFDILGRGLQITAAGSFAGNTNVKTVKLIVNCTTAVVGSTVTGGTTICSTGAVATNGGGWQVSGNLFKYGVAGSNTQIGIHSQAQIGAVTAAILVPSLVTATESGAILIAVTGNAATTATDIVFNFLEVNAMN